MYLVNDPPEIIYQYTLSIAWDITTAIYSGKYFDLGKQDANPADIFFNPDGSIMYMLGNDNDTVFQYGLNGKKQSPWDISSLFYKRIKLDISAQNTDPWGFFFSPDGTKFYTLDTFNDMIYQYNLSVPWDITSGLYSGTSYQLGEFGTQPTDIAFSPDGKNLYISDFGNDKVHQYTLSIPWDLSTIVYSYKYLDVHDQDTWPWSISFSINGSIFFILGFATNTLYQYTLPEIPPPPPKKEASRTGIYSFKTLKI